MKFEILLVAFLATGSVPGQDFGHNAPKSLPIAWLSVRSTGSWFDEGDPAKPRKLMPGDPIYPSSRLVRRDPKSASDTAWLSIPDGSYQGFPCSEALVCDGALDLKKVAQRAAPRLHSLQLIVNTMSGRRRPLVRGVLHDGAADLAAGVQARDVFNADDAAGTYSLAWCPDALSQKCSDEPVAITVDWNPNRPATPVPSGPLVAGLHRLILLRQIEGEWFYTEDDAWVLILQGKDAARRVAGVTDALRTLRDETRRQADQVTARVRAVALLAGEADASQ